MVPDIGGALLFMAAVGIIIGMTLLGALVSVFAGVFFGLTGWPLLIPLGCGVLLGVAAAAWIVRRR
jgi:hypothetical protein